MLTFEKSGLNKKLIPSFAPDNVNDFIAQITNNISNIGIKILVTFSIPFFIPEIKIIATTVNTTNTHIAGGKIDVVIAKDLSRIGRNNGKVPK